MNVSLAAALVSGSAAFVSSYFWARAALVRTPEHRELTVDQVDFDWLTKPLVEQAKYNSKAAVFAAIAGIAGIIAALLGAQTGRMQ